MVTKRRMTLASLTLAGVLTLAACGSEDTRSVTLRWEPPTSNEDGTDLADLAGFRVYWRRYGSPAVNSVEIDDPSTTSFKIEDLPSGEWRAGVTAFTEDAKESDVATVAFWIRDDELEVDESALGQIASRTEFNDADLDEISLTVSSKNDDARARPD